MSPKPITENTLFYGDNLFILREHIPSESVDLIYLDPPFNSSRSYNVLFKDEHGTESEAQITAFEDTWHWNLEAEHTYTELLTEAPDHVAKMIESLREFIGTNQMMAYLVMMAARLVELHRVLKATGSLYLHCDPTASHYLKIILDTVFGAQNFRNEIIWKRTSAHNTTTRKFGDITDTIFFYTKTNNYLFSSPRQPHDETYVEKFYRFTETDGRRYRQHLIERNQALGIRPNLIYEYKGYTPTYGWMMERIKLEELDRLGKLGWSSKGRPFRKIYIDEVEKPPVGNLWDDIPPIQSQSKELLGYPTQKPLALLDRIIQASSNPGDVVLDPFCGCGTAITSAQKLGRRWIGIDITHLSIALQKYRLEAMFPGIKFKVVGEPTDIGAARQLANEDRYQFQWWALSLIRARPLGGEAGSREGKKGSDKGIDGVIAFIDDNTGKAKRVLVQVKSGHVNSSLIRDLVGTVQREQAAIGVFITLENPTRDMNTEALKAGFYYSPGWNRNFQRIQILTIDELLQAIKAGKTQLVDMPPQFGTFKQAQRVQQPEALQGELGLSTG